MVRILAVPWSFMVHLYHSPDSSDVSSLDEELIQKEYERLIMKKKRGWSKKSQNPPQSEVGALMCEVLHRVNEIAMP